MKKQLTSDDFVPVRHRVDFDDLSDQAKGDLMVKRFAGKRGTVFYWECQCSCGKIVFVQDGRIRNGNKTHCGCKRVKTPPANKRHGMKGTRQYEAWRSMKKRCLPSNKWKRKDYHDRGIHVSKRWLNSFDTFWGDMKDTYEPHLTLERRDNNLGYSKENCYWATQERQANNKRNNVIVNLDGEKKTAMDWAREKHLSGSKIRKRIAAGWSAKEALSA